MNSLLGIVAQYLDISQTHVAIHMSLTRGQVSCTHCLCLEKRLSLVLVAVVLATIIVSCKWFAIVKPFY